MKHQHLIDKFHKNRDENDGYADIIWLPAFPGGGLFNNILPAPRTDILAAYLPDEVSDSNRLQFLTSSADDRNQAFVDLGDLPFSIQKLIYDYIF